MDLNKLFYHHQKALMNRNTARSADDKTAYFDLVEYYAKRIRQARYDAGIPRLDGMSAANC